MKQHQNLHKRMKMERMEIDRLKRKEKLNNVKPIKNMRKNH